MVPTRFADMVRRAGSRGQDLFDGATIETHISPDAETIQINADEEMLSIAVMNLLENAVKFSPDQKPVTLIGWIDDDFAVIAVRDEGIGIPSDELKKVLSPAVRGSNIGQIGGTGLGLSLVDRIVAGHRGTLTIDSAVNQGTTVGIRLRL
jgi:signal transduction histidine kinase